MPETPRSELENMQINIDNEAEKIRSPMLDLPSFVTPEFLRRFVPLTNRADRAKTRWETPYSRAESEFS
jgi:hypothetical protein